MQNKFAFFANFAETIRSLPENKQADAYKAICEFGIYGELPDDVLLKSLCLMAQNSIYKNVGGAPVGNKNAEKKQPQNNLKTTQNNLETTSKQPTFQETRNKKQETETESETRNKKQENKDSDKSLYAFTGSVIRLNQKDFDEWSVTFPELNLRAELMVRDQYLAKQSDTEKKNWFMSTFQYFIKQNEKRKAQNKDFADEDEEDFETWLKRSV